MCPTREDHEDEVLISTRKKVKKPRKYAVVLHNDDYTTQEFVVQVLKLFFNRSEADARTIMLTVHLKGRGIAGTYSKDIAESKVEQVTDFSRSQGAPLKLSTEPA